MLKDIEDKMVLESNEWKEKYDTLAKINDEQRAHIVSLEAAQKNGVDAEQVKQLKDQIKQLEPELRKLRSQIEADEAQKKGLERRLKDVCKQYTLYRVVYIDIDFFASYRLIRGLLIWRPN